MSTETAYDITRGIDRAIFAALPEEQRAAVVTLLARVAERSYRRGFQQGAHIATARPRDLPDDIHDWRYNNSTDQSPWADCARVELAIDRLHCENPGLARLGL